MPKKQTQPKMKTKWSFLKHPLFVGISVVVIGALLTYTLKNSSTTTSAINGNVANSNTVNIKGNNSGQVAGGNIINNSVVIPPTNPTIQEQINYYRRQAQGHLWQPPELPAGQESVWVKFGGAEVQYGVSELGGNQPPMPRIVLPGGILVTPYIKNNRLFVKVPTPFGDSENTTVQMNNEMDAKIPTNWDRNYDSTRFEIVDDSKLPVLQVEYNQPFEVAVYGIFVAANGAVSVAFGDDISGVAPNFPLPNIPERKAWFKYPSTEHLGDRADQ
jgi:hypothetical protein